MTVNVVSDALSAPGPAGLVGAAAGWIAYEYGAFDDVDQVTSPAVAAALGGGIVLAIHLVVS